MLPAYLTIRSYQQRSLSKYWEVKIFDGEKEFDVGHLLDTIDASVNHIAGYIVDCDCKLPTKDLQIRGITGITTNTIEYNQFELIRKTESELVHIPKISGVSNDRIHNPVRITISDKSPYLIDVRDITTGIDAEIESFTIKISTIPFGPKCIIL